MIKVFEKATEGIKTGVKNGIQWVKDNKGSILAGVGALVATAGLIVLAGKAGNDEDTYYELDEAEFDVYDVDDDEPEVEESVDVEVSEED